MTLASVSLFFNFTDLLLANPTRRERQRQGKRRFLIYIFPDIVF